MAGNDNQTLLYIGLAAAAYYVYANYIQPANALTAANTPTLPTNVTIQAPTTTPVTSTSASPATNAQQPMRGQGWNTRFNSGRSSVVQTGTPRIGKRPIATTSPVFPATSSTSPGGGIMFQPGSQISIGPGQSLPTPPSGTAWQAQSMNGTAVVYLLVNTIPVPADSGGILESQTIAI